MTERRQSGLASRHLALLLLAGCAGAPPVLPHVARGSSSAETECERARSHAVANLERARVARRCGDERAAERYYRAALRAEPRCEIALELAASMPPEAAREVLAPFAALPAPDLDTLAPEICRGAALRLAELLRGRDDDAPVPLLAALLARDPTDADALAQLALHYLAREQVGAAESVCERMPDDHAEGMRACGLVALRTGSLHVAEARLRASIAAEPTGPALRPLGALLVSTRRHREAVTIFERLHRSDPRDYGALVDLGSALVWAGCADAGRSAYRAAIALDPDRPEAWYDLGLVYRFILTEQQAMESLHAFARVREIAEGRPELEPLVRSIRDDACLAQRRAARTRRSRPACDPGHEMHIIWMDRSSLDFMALVIEAEQTAAQPAPAESGAPALSCDDYVQP